MHRGIDLGKSKIKSTNRPEVLSNSVAGVGLKTFYTVQADSGHGSLLP